MSLIMSYLFLGMGVTICAIASWTYFSQEYQQNKVFSEDIIEKKVRIEPKKVNKGLKSHEYVLNAADHQNKDKQDTIKIKTEEIKKIRKTSFLTFLLGSKKRRPSGDKIYRVRIHKLAVYMQRNLERGVPFTMLHEQLKTVGWQEREILIAHSKLKR
ncbi:hypothetical protein J4410_02665 [Candidatus Woesearchaeota archaeon]|nr:hypothetical protein [Candidatus Woesearchaeota archaeon]